MFIEWSKQIKVDLCPLSSDNLQNLLIVLLGFFKLVSQHNYSQSLPHLLSENASAKMLKAAGHRLMKLGNQTCSRGCLASFLDIMKGTRLHQESL